MSVDQGWKSPTELPAEPGVYEIASGSYRYFDGKLWYWGDSRQSVVEKYHKQAGVRPGAVPRELWSRWRVPV